MNIECYKCSGTGIEGFYNHGFAEHGYDAIEAIRCSLCDGVGWLHEDNTLYYRWVVINNQETCYCRVVELLDGFFKSAEDVKAHYSDDFCFVEHLFSIKPLEFSATPKWLAIKTGEFVN